ncbi:MAG: hypothetical protein V4515_12810 [Chloroflexota bacterium]
MTDLVTADVDQADGLVLTAPISMRWSPGLLERADAAAAMAGPGVTRSVILRMACERGMSDVEEMLTALRTGR